MKEIETLNTNLEADAINGIICKYRNKYDIETNKKTIKIEDIYKNENNVLAKDLADSELVTDNLMVILTRDWDYEREYSVEDITVMLELILTIKVIMENYSEYFTLRNQFVKETIQYGAYNRLLNLNHNILLKYALSPESIILKKKK